MLCIIMSELRMDLHLFTILGRFQSLKTAVERQLLVKSDSVFYIIKFGFGAIKSFPSTDVSK